MIHSALPAGSAAAPKVEPILVTIESAAEDTVSFVDSAGITDTCVTDSLGVGTALLMPGETYTFTSSKAKDIDDSSKPYSKNVTLTQSTDVVKVYPTDENNEAIVARWYGNNCGHKILTLRIASTNSNPTTCLSFYDDASTMSQAEVNEFLGYYPCLFKDGAEVGKLNPNNYAQFENGATADITTVGNDVMVAFPRRGLYIKTVDNYVEVSMTDAPQDMNNEYEYNAHTRGTDTRDVFYLGAYKGYVSGNKLYSSSEKTITARQTIGTFRTYAHNRGDGYEQSAFYQLTYRQCAYLFVHKSLNSQSAVGMGYVLSSHTSPTSTGNTNAYGMNSEIIKASNPSYMTDQNHQVKCLGIEDFWGNAYEFIDGLVSDSSRNVLTANSGFNDSGSGYTNNGNGGVSSNIGGYISKPQGTTKTGFVAKAVSGSESTYFCDYASLYASCVVEFGGGCNNATFAGAFRLSMDDDASRSDASVTARLMYL